MTDREFLGKIYALLQAEPRATVICDQLEDMLTERLAQPEQEPVAWGMLDINGRIYDCISVEEHAQAEGDYNVPLYRLFDNG